MPVTIRPALPSEAAAVLQLTLAAYMPYRDRLHPPSGVFRETVVDVARAMDEGVVFVAVEEGAGGEAVLVGVARVRAATEGDGAGRRERALYCGRLAVLPQWQRRGIGTLLMERVERYACESAYSAVALGVRLELPGNLRFYTGRGYRVVSQESHPGYTTPTFVWMRKDLA